MRTLGLLLGLFLIAVSQARPQFDGLQKKLGLPGSSGGMDSGKVASGLKEALEVGTVNTVTQTGAKDGYWSNQAIKILMPEKLRGLEKGLRMAGGGAQIDEFELSMNRAAEKAAPGKVSLLGAPPRGETLSRKQRKKGKKRGR